MIKFSETVENIIKSYQTVLGKDYDGYRNHLYRLINLCEAVKPLNDTESEKIAIAAVFHDLAIWTEHTADYVGPSEALAKAYLRSIEFPEWEEDVCSIIREHHKFTACDKGLTLAEIFRRADWIDVTSGLRSFGVPRKDIQWIMKEFPDEGFHPLLAGVIRNQIIKHPLNPLPMFKW